MTDDAEAGPRAGVTTQRMERATAAILLLIGVVVGYQSYRLGAGWTSDGPGSGYFPFYVGLILAVSGLGVLVQSALAQGRGDALFADTTQIRRVASILVPAMVYVLGVQFVGIYVGSAVYIALFMIVLGKYAWFSSVVAAVIVSLVFFLMFELWFKVPLYKGRLDLLGLFG